MIELSSNAIDRINSQLEKRGSGIGIRIGVKSTGCSGFSYVLEFVDISEPNDEVYKVETFSVFVDQKSLL